MSGMVSRVASLLRLSAFGEEAISPYLTSSRSLAGRTAPGGHQPHQWTSKLAAEYVVAVAHMKVGDFCTAASLRRMKEKIGLSLSANAKERQLVAMRILYREIQDDPHHVP